MAACEVSMSSLGHAIDVAATYSNWPWIAVALKVWPLNTVAVLCSLEQPVILAAQGACTVASADRDSALFL